MTPQELQIRNLRQEQLKAQRKGDHLQALKLNMQIIDLQKQATEVKVDLIDLFKQLPKELAVKMLTNMNGIALMIDWIDLLTMEINDTIKTVDKDSTVHHFDSIIQLGKEAKKYMNFMHQKTGESYQNAIAENSDELLEKTLKEVKKIMTKMN